MAIQEESPPKHAESPTGDSPRKRRKVNHACIYCRRSHMTCDLERPCARCIKRSIGHLCHDEPRETGKGKNGQDLAPLSNAAVAEPTHRNQDSVETIYESPGANPLLLGPSADMSFEADDASAGQSYIPTTQQAPDPASEMQGMGDTNQQFMRYGNWGFANPVNDPDLDNLYTPYMFSAPDIGSEYNVLNNFLNTSLFEEGNAAASDNTQFQLSDSNNSQPTLGAVAPANLDSGVTTNETGPPSTLESNSTATTFSQIKPKSTRPIEKEEERVYMNIADPSGNDKPEERMKRLLEAKFKAGLLRPFNYIQGYARLNAYLEGHMQPALRQKMMRHVDKFRPKFRERMQSLTDMELTMVEMWFEKALMEYDRVFASMAIPACCWRRTGEIFRGNKAMAELIHVPVDELRDGQLALQEIMAEKDLVNYWDNFLAIAFDNSQKAMLTTCHLRKRDAQNHGLEVKCCFSFTIRRDARHNIPSLIVGNFLPQVERQA